jgi:hypothetical protein
VDIKKHLLDEIVSLGFVPENPLTDISHKMSITSEEQSKGLTVARADIGQKRFVGKFCCRGMNLRDDRQIRRRLWS